MALDRSGLLEVLDALKVADVGDRVRQATETVYQALIEASSPTRSAPRCTSARSRASTCVTVTAPASCPPRRGIGPRAAGQRGPLPVPPDERRQPCRRPGSLRILWRAVGSAAREGAARIARTSPALRRAPASPIAASATTRRRHSAAIPRRHQTTPTRPARRPHTRICAGRVT